MCPFEAEFRSGTGRPGWRVRDKVVRILQIAWMLQSRARSVDELARHFGVSRRTIYRDLKLIDEADLPLAGRAVVKGVRPVPQPQKRAIDPGSIRNWI
jgi:hypothetical protein